MDNDVSPDGRQDSPASRGSSPGREAAPPPAAIPDHELLRCIGRGSYGQVWLARNQMGRYRAVKFVYRESFDNRRPFERELSGIRKFEPVSRSHDGFIDVLHVGINDEQEYFYYVMELGDDQARGQDIDPANYSPKTLAREISRRGRLPLKECLQMGVVLSDALAELHRNGLVHRDVKPSNIIFVNGVAKLADIGLVAEFSEARSYVGTEGFIPPEGPGNPQADIYSLGKSLYEASTGRDRQEFPALPPEFDQSADHEEFLELNTVLLRACHQEAGKRYLTAAKLQSDLAGLAGGKSLTRLKLERCGSVLKRLAVVALLGVAILAVYHQLNRERPVVITAFSPASGPIGTELTITGREFDPLPAGNIVFFGGVRGRVKSASDKELIVQVPPGAAYAPITVTARGLTACTGAPFGLTFPGGGTIDSSSLAPRLDFLVGHGPFKVVTGDLDGDGKQDLVVVHTYDGSIWILRNVSVDGILTTNSFVPSALLHVGGSPYGLVGAALGDLNGDGLLDLVVANQGKNKVSIFQNLGGPGGITQDSFGPRIDAFTGAGPRDLAVRDLDGDGHPDLITANYGSDSLSLLRNRGGKGKITTRTFAPQVELATGNSASSVAIGDLDGDGRPDLVAASGGDESICVFRNLSLPGTLDGHSFAPRLDFAGGGESVAVGDLDGDGVPDVVVGFYLNERLSIYHNTTAPGGAHAISLAPPVNYALGGRVHHVVIGDLDGDGKPDIALVTELESKLALFRNISTPGSLTTSSLAAQADFSSGWNACGLVMGDLNGDGRPEIVFANSYSNSVSIYRNVLRQAVR